MNNQYDPTLDYKKQKELAQNPMQMATRIIALEKTVNSVEIFNTPNRKEGLLQQLKRLDVDSHSGDSERAHGSADDLLLEYINDPDITEAYGRIEKWYA